MNTSDQIRYNTTFELRPYTGKELRNMYGVSRKTFKTWLKPIQEKLGERLGHYYNIEQVRIIVNHLGIPGSVDLL